MNYILLEIKTSSSDMHMDPALQEAGMDNLQPQVAWSNPCWLGRAKNETHSTKQHLGIFNYIGFLSSLLAR